MNNKIKNVTIIVLASLLIIALISIFVLFKNYKDNSQILELNGKIVVVGNDYAIIEAEGEDYLIKNIKGKYKEEDIIKVKYTKDFLDENDSPKTLKIIDEELVKSNIYFDDSASEADNINNNTSNKSENPSINNSFKPNSQVNGNQPKPNNQVNDNSKPNSTSSTNEDADTAILSYFNELETDLKSQTITSSLKTGFINVIDFLFYNGQIKGYTFKDLSSSAKLKVLSIALYFDSKIDEYFPGYKESIINTSNKIYTNIKERIVKTYLDITSSICLENAEFCAAAKEEFAELKTNFGLTWSLIKDIASDGINNLKSWYEIWSGK